jgi:hypothetical protein
VFIPPANTKAEVEGMRFGYGVMEVTNDLPELVDFREIQATVAVAPSSQLEVATKL